MLENSKSYKHFLSDMARLQAWLEEAENNQNETGEKADSVQELQVLIMQHRVRVISKSIERILTGNKNACKIC